jgi:hypothetical protein
LSGPAAVKYSDKGSNEAFTANQSVQSVIRTRC